MLVKQKYTPVRFSHLTSYAGIGAVVRDSNDILMTVADIRYWTDKNGICTAQPIPYVTRITNALDIGKDLRTPPQAKEMENGAIQGHYLPAVLFPGYAKCKKCGLLHNNPWEKIDLHSHENLRCRNEKCKGQLEQVTWCAVSKQGYLDEVPWHYICHLGSNQSCRVDFKSTYLRLTVNKDGKKIVQCTRCGRRSQFSNKKIGIINKQQPWVFDKPQPVEEQDVEIMEINNPGVYFPKQTNALVIPPESRMNKDTVVDRLYNNSRLCRELESIRSPLRKKGKIRKLATEYRCKVEEIHDALRQIRNGYPPMEIISSGDMLEDEYQALLTPLENMREDEDFVTDHKTVHWRELSSSLSGELLSINRLINSLIVVKRLREIQIFMGFRRQSPDFSRKELVVPPDIEGTAEWLPAIELFGEGVFFTFAEELLADWENIPGVRTRVDEIGGRYEHSGVTLVEAPTVTARFLLLHTFAHLLIRVLETTSGYPAASLKERIYCSSARKMSGILIYTAVPDIAGSLGGIIESAEPLLFLSLLDNVFKHAQWCSLDPVCSEHEGQGPGWLNRAACHGCALIPEPSCAFNNVLLDRIFIKGSQDLGIPNLLEYVGEQING
jgi:uncharacterized C2H2 Zn-finger protein